MKVKIKDPKMVERGKRNKRSGNQLEAKARAALTDAGYIICRWQNTVVDGKLVGAKPKWNFFTKSLSYSSVGFPDYLVMKPIVSNLTGAYQIFGLEVKCSGYLDQEERKKADWYLDNKIFPKLIIAKKDKASHLIFIDYKTKQQILIGDLFK